MNDILDIYKHCIVAKYELGWEMLSKSNESFFEEIFDKKKPEPKSELLKFQEFNKIVETVYRTYYQPFEISPYFTSFKKYITQSE